MLHSFQVVYQTSHTLDAMSQFPTALKYGPMNPNYLPYYEEGKRILEAEAAASAPTPVSITPTKSNKRHALVTLVCGLFVSVGILLCALFLAATF